jgi:hypothetical protein
MEVPGNRKSSASLSIMKDFSGTLLVNPPALDRRSGRACFHSIHRSDESKGHDSAINVILVTIALIANH